MARSEVGAKGRGAHWGVASGLLIVCVALALIVGLVGVLAGDGRSRRPSERPWVLRYSGWWLLGWAIVLLGWCAIEREPTGVECACSGEAGLGLGVLVAIAGLMAPWVTALTLRPGRGEQQSESC